MPTDPPKKRASANKTSTPRKRTAAKKSTAKKPARAGRKPKTAGTTKPDTLHHVARSIGSTLGTIAKKATNVVKAAKDALPAGLKPSDDQGD